MRSKSLPIILLLLVALFPIGPLKISTIQNAHATAQTESLVGYASTGWKTPDGTVNPTITIPHGKLLNMTNSSGDGARHQFYVDIDGNGQRDYPIDPIADGAPPSSMTTLGYFAPGSYTYYCAIHPQTMHGTFTVLPPPGSNFAITPNWWLSIIVHGSQSSLTTITVSSLNGFSGTVNLSPPTVPTGITASLSKSVVSITPLAPATTVLNLTAGPSIPEGKYTVTLDGSDGTSSQTASVTTLVYVAHFELYGSQSLPVPLGSSRNDTFTVASAWGFYGSVSFDTTVSPPGPRASLNTTQVSITPYKFAHVLLTIDTAGARLGDYNVTITATSGPTMSRQFLYRVSAWQPPSPAPPQPAIDLSLLTMMVILGSVIAIAIVTSTWGSRRAKQAQSDVESGKAVEETESPSPEWRMYHLSIAGRVTRLRN